MANPVDIELHASGVETADGVGDPVDITATSAETSHARSGAKLTLEISAISGVELIVAIETAPTLDGSWITVPIAFPSMARVVTLDQAFAGLRRYVRARWYLQGSGSATFVLSGQAHTLYCEPKDLTRANISPRALEDLPAHVLASACLRATSDAETAMNSAYELPLSAWGEDLRGHTAARAVFYAAEHRGFDQERDRPIVMAGGYRTPEGVKSAAQTFFDAVAAGNLKPVGVVDATPDEYEGSGVVVSGPRRF